MENGSDSFIIDSIAKVMDELPEIGEILPKPSASEDEDSVNDEKANILPKPSATRMRKSEDDENAEIPDKKMKQILLKEKTSELRSLRSEGLLPKLRPKIETLLNEYIDLGDTDSDEDTAGSNESLDSRPNIPEILDPNLRLPEENFVFGLKEDCFRLLSKFSASKDRRFKDFAKVWREMKFSGVFRQHELLDYDDLKLIFDCDDDDDDDDNEEEEEEEDDDDEVDDEEDEKDLRMKYIMNAVPEVFLIAKIFMLPEYPKSFRKGAFFLLYALYYRQPFKTDDTLKIGEFAVRFDLTEFCLFKQIYEGETEEGKCELRKLYDRLIEDGGIEIKTTFHDPSPYVEDNELRAWYFMRLIQETGAIELVNEEWKNAFADYKNSFDDGSGIKFHETLWKFMEKNKDDLSPLPKVEHSPIPNVFDDDEGPGFSVLQGGTRTVKEYLNEIPDIIPDRDPRIICLDDSSSPTPSTSITEADMLPTSSP